MPVFPANLNIMSLNGINGFAILKEVIKPIANKIFDRPNPTLLM